MAKADYLFAYGNQLNFQLQLDLQDVTEADAEALAVFKHLLGDFQKGDLVLGGEKAVGFGWVKAKVTGLEWRAGQNDALTTKLFPEAALSAQGIWQALKLDGAAATQALGVASALTGAHPAEPPKATSRTAPLVGVAACCTSKPKSSALCTSPKAANPRMPPPCPMAR
jgi:hypothetical protein